MPPDLLADLVVAVHLVVVVFMVVMTAAVPVAWTSEILGWRFPWAWVRSPWLRFPHLAIFVYIAFDAWFGKLCFLTTWEASLRERAGQRSPEQYSFVGRLLHDALFVDVSEQVLNAAYLALFVLTVLFALLLPARRPGPISPPGSPPRKRPGRAA